MMKSDIIDCVKRLSLKSINKTTGILTLTIFSIVVIFISMFTNLWMIGTWEGEEGEYQYGYFGLHEESSEFDGDTYILDYSFDDCKSVFFLILFLKIKTIYTLFPHPSGWGC